MIFLDFLIQFTLLNHFLIDKTMFSTAKRFITMCLGALLTLPAFAAELQLRVINTSDVQAQLTDFDYDQDRKQPRYGYTRTATLIKKAQREVKNNVYVDNGNILQGAPMGDYMLAKGLETGEQHPSYLALEKSGAVATVLGKREFAYGLNYLDKAVATSNVPVLSANVFDANTKAPRYRPYLFKILDLKDTQGAPQRVNVAFIGLTSPDIIRSSQQDLQGKILVSDVVLTAKKYVPLLKNLGADVIIALNQSPEHQAALKQVVGIDAVISPTQLQSQGKEIAILDLNLNNNSGKWRITQQSASTRAIFDEETNKPLVGNQLLTKWVLRSHHKGTRQFMAQPVGKTADNLYSYLSLVQDDPTVQLVNTAQKEFVKREIATQPELAKLPVLSATSPLKTGKQHTNVFEYTTIERGDVSRRQLTELVETGNTVAAVKVNGAELKEWLECSAGAFNQIQPAHSQTQPLMNWQFNSQQFDVIDGVSYQFDLSQAARYNHDCQLQNDKTQRVKQLTFQGKPVEKQAEFIVATNAKRAFEGKFAGTGAKKVVLNSSVDTRQVVSDFIREQTATNGAANSHIDHNWRFAPVNAKVSFETAASERAKAFTALQAARPYSWLGQDEKGFGVYQFDLAK